MPDARHDAEFLLAVVLETDRGGVYVRRRDTLETGRAERYRAWIERRSAREPLQHLSGEQEFLGHTFQVDSRALIPRPSRSAGRGAGSTKNCLRAPPWRRNKSTCAVYAIPTAP